MPAIAAPRAALGCGLIVFGLWDDRGREHAFDAPGVGGGQFAGNIRRRPRKGGISGKGCAALGDAARVALLPLLKALNGSSRTKGLGVAGSLPPFWRL